MNYGKNPEHKTVIESRVTIKEVAEKTRVSTTTVSRIVNGISGHYSDKTKERVLRAIKRLNYQPNIVARALRSKKTNTVGFVVPELQAFFADVLDGAQSVAWKKWVLCFLV